jgi:pathogenesis-related protein 1
MRAVHAVIALTVAAGCTGEIDGGGGDDDGSNGGGDGGGTGTGSNVDAAPVVGEPPGLVGTTDAHNVERAEVGVPPLTWDPDLAAIAQAWAMQCVDTSAPIGLVDHNPNRGQGYPESVGENIYGSGGQASGTAAVALWIQEQANYNYAANSCNGVCGHWTQVVWRTTTKVGCGLHTCPGLQYGSTVVCNYAPAGNNGSRPY